MTSIFISYAREDHATARVLALQFAMRGASVWWDRSLLSGERYIDVILRQIAQADQVLLLLSRHSAKSRWVAFEVGAASAREQVSGADILRVAKLGRCAVPDFVGKRHCTPISSTNVGPILPSLRLPNEIDYKPPPPTHDASLTVFRAGGQWMELIAHERGLDCVLVDAGDQRARLLWSIPRSGLGRARVDVRPPRPERGWSTFEITGVGEWRWTPALFTSSRSNDPRATLKHEIENLIKGRAERRPARAPARARRPRTKSPVSRTSRNTSR